MPVFGIGHDALQWKEYAVHPQSLKADGLPGTMGEAGGKMSVQGDGWTVGLPDNLAQQARGQNTQRVLLGIRPEHIMPAAIANGGAANSNKINTDVEVVENMGSHQYVYIAKSGMTLTAEFPADFEVQPEQKVDVVFDPDNLHLFDEQSGNAIGHSRSAVA